MKVKELINLLQEMPQDLEVYGYCNHGQTPEKVLEPTVAYTSKLGYSIIDGWCSEEDEEINKPFVLL